MKQLVSARGLAKRLQIDEATVRSWVRSGKLVQGRHYTVSMDRRIYLWPACHADFIHRKESE